MKRQKRGREAMRSYEKWNKGRIRRHKRRQRGRESKDTEKT